MKYLLQSLNKNEKIVKEFKFHWILKAMIIILVVLAIPTMGITLLFAIPILIKLLTTEQAVTNKRVLFKTGLIARRTEEIRLVKVETVELEQSVLGRLLGYGTVKLTGTGIGVLKFKAIDNPIQVKKDIEETIDNQDSYNVSQNDNEIINKSNSEEKPKNEQKVFEEDGYTIEYKY